MCKEIYRPKKKENNYSLTQRKISSLSSLKEFHYVSNQASSDNESTRIKTQTEFLRILAQAVLVVKTNFLQEQKLQKKKKKERKERKVTIQKL